MGLQDLNPGNLGGTLILLIAVAALLPSFDIAIDSIIGQTSGITETLALLIVPLILLAILGNLFEPDRGR